MKKLTIGRDPGNQVVLKNDFVSRRHAELIINDDGSLVLRDLSSSNGTFVNGHRIKEVLLKEGDQVSCASSNLNWKDLVFPQWTASPGEQPFKSGNGLASSPIEAVAPAQQPVAPPPQNASPAYHQNIVVVGKQKSVGTAFLLAFLFGPLGLLYASVIGGFVMFFLGILSFFILPVLGYFFIIVPVCVIWAVIAANNANAQFLNRSAPLIQNN